MFAPHTTSKYVHTYMNTHTQEKNTFQIALDSRLFGHTIPSFILHSLSFLTRTVFLA